MIEVHSIAQKLTGIEIFCTTARFNENGRYLVWLTGFASKATCNTDHRAKDLSTCCFSPEFIWEKNGSVFVYLRFPLTNSFNLHISIGELEKTPSVQLHSVWSEFLHEFSHRKPRVKKKISRLYGIRTMDISKEHESNRITANKLPYQRDTTYFVRNRYLYVR